MAIDKNKIKLISEVDQLNADFREAIAKGFGKKAAQKIKPKTLQALQEIYLPCDPTLIDNETPERQKDPEVIEYFQTGQFTERDLLLNVIFPSLKKLVESRPLENIKIKKKKELIAFHLSDLDPQNPKHFYLFLFRLQVSF